MSYKWIYDNLYKIYETFARGRHKAEYFPCIIAVLGLLFTVNNFFTVKQCINY